MTPPPHHRYTLPPKQAKIVLKSVFFNKINTLSVVILWLPTHYEILTLKITLKILEFHEIAQDKGIE